MEILIVFCVFGLLSLLMLFLNRLLGPRSTNPAKEQPFECGSPPLETGIKPYAVKFYRDGCNRGARRLRRHAQEPHVVPVLLELQPCARR